MVIVCQQHSRAKPNPSRRGELLLTLLLLCCPVAPMKAQDVYKTVDAQGHVVYSDQALPSPMQPYQDQGNDRDSGSEMRANTPPPPLPDSDQPPCSEDGDLWTPGYWAWNGTAYYWVPGAWVAPPRVGVLWTPGYWAFVDTVYVFHRGYWGPQVGYYGGINYRFGYGGVGFVGGRWIGNSFAYNRAITNVNANVIHNSYDEAVAHHVAFNGVSYNGGPGGTTAVPTAQEKLAAAQLRLQYQPQRVYIQPASSNVAATAQAGSAHSAGAVVPRQAVLNAPATKTMHQIVAPHAASHATYVRAPGNTTAHPLRSTGQPNPPRSTPSMSTKPLLLGK
jgi:hypothetical protein